MRLGACPPACNAVALQAVLAHQVGNCFLRRMFGIKMCAGQELSGNKYPLLLRTPVHKYGTYCRRGTGGHTSYLSRSD